MSLVGQRRQGDRVGSDFLSWHFSDLAPSEAQVRDTPMSGHRTCRTPQVCIAQRSLAATASIARLALCVAAWSCAFPRQTDPTGQITSDFPKSCQAQELKIFRFRRRANQGHINCHPVPPRGASAIVTNVGQGAVDADAPLTNGAEAYGEDVWS